jgi:hypothetical protein
MLATGCAFVVLTTILSGLSGNGTRHPLAWLCVALNMVLILWAFIRLGFVTVLAMTLVSGLLLVFPLTANLSAWYAGHGLTAMAVVFGWAVAGFLIAKGRQPLFPGPPW